jgi:hypothetical protein
MSNACSTTHLSPFFLNLILSTAPQRVAVSVLIKHTALNYWLVLAWNAQSDENPMFNMQVCMEWNTWTLCRWSLALLVTFEWSDARAPFPSAC